MLLTKHKKFLVYPKNEGIRRAISVENNIFRWNCPCCNGRARRTSNKKFTLRNHRGN